MNEEETSTVRIFELQASPEDLIQDRLAVAEFLEQYLVTGAVPRMPKLATGQIRLDGRREPIGQSSWKWSEMAGKYVGCPFWSVEALKTFETVAAQQPDKSASSIGRSAASKRLKGYRLQHEHVFPRKAWGELMAPLVGNWEAGKADELVARMDRYCIGCVVTYGEHLELGDVGVSSNPWMRYARTSIRLVENPHWTEPHRAWIEEAKLVDR